MPSDLGENKKVTKKKRGPTPTGTKDRSLLLIISSGMFSPGFVVSVENPGL